MGGGAGRPQKPLQIHKLNGNPSKIKDLDSLIEKEPKPTKLNVNKPPSPPAWLDDIAKAEWKRVAKELIKMELLTKVDLSALEAYCKTYSRWRAAEEQMDKIGSTVYKPSKKDDSTYLSSLPQVQVAQKYLVICKTFMAEFGLTPSARSRMAIKEYEDDAGSNGEVDGMGEILKLKDQLLKKKAT